MPMYELVLWFQGNEDIRITINVSRSVKRC
jgi:hypothetical protein